MIIRSLSPTVFVTQTLLFGSYVVSLVMNGQHKHEMFFTSYKVHGTYSIIIMPLSTLCVDLQKTECVTDAGMFLRMSFLYCTCLFFQD